MNNAINSAVQRIMHEIPPQILDIAFMRRQSYATVSLQQRIIDLVVNQRVRPDCNLMGGRTVQISLQSSYHEQTLHNLSHINSGTGQYSIYRIPPEARYNSDIMEVHHIQFPSPYGNSQGGSYGATSDPLCVTKNELLASHTGQGGPGPTPTVELLQGDLIRLYPGMHAHLDWMLTCRVAYDENMTNLNTSAIDSFANLSVIATQMYIYNNLIVELDRGYIEGGADIPAIRNIVEQWSDLKEEYATILKQHFVANVTDIQRIAVYLQHML